MTALVRKTKKRSLALNSVQNTIVHARPIDTLSEIVNKRVEGRREPLYLTVYERNEKREGQKYI